MRYAMPLVLLAALAVVAAGTAGCGRKPAKQSATISEAVEVTEPAPAAAAPATEEAPEAAGDTTVYTLTEDSYIGWAGKKPLGTHFGQFPSYEGTVTVSNGDVTTARAEVTFHVSELTSDDTRLTGTLLNENWFHTEAHPTARFVSTKIEPSPNSYTVTGNLELRGMTKSVRFPAKITLEDGTLTLSAEFSIDRTAWGVGQGLAEDLIVSDDVAIEMEVIAEAASGS